MSQLYFKRCNRCAKISEAANTPNPPGWQCLADLVHGTLATIDICPACQENMGLRVLLAKAIRDRAVGELRAAIETDPDKMPPALDMAELENRINAGEFDAAFAAGDGINLDDIADAEVIAEGELVE